MSKSRSAYCVLGCLSSGPKSGYDIRTMMNEITGFFWKESDGQLYPALKKLVEKGFIQQSTTESARNKKVYTITEPGLQYLQEWLVTPAAPAQVRSEFMLKVFLSNEMPREKVIAHIERERQQVKERMQALTELVKSLEHHHGNERVVESWKLSLDAGMELAEAELRWCERSILALSAKVDQADIMHNPYHRSEGGHE